MSKEQLLKLARELTEEDFKDAKPMFEIPELMELFEKPNKDIKKQYLSD